MNRYLIAALYVMAGCAVTIPLKAQGNVEPLRGERCRLIITNTVKVISVYLEEEQAHHESCGLPFDSFILQDDNVPASLFFINKSIQVKRSLFYPSSHRIRAPEI